jgi:hypothetical protein
VRFLFYGPDGGGSRTCGLVQRQPSDFQHYYDFSLRFGQSSHQRFEVEEWISTLKAPGPIREHVHCEFVRRYSAGPPIAVNPRAASDGVHPRKDRLTGPIGMSHPMYAHPRFLEQIIGVLPARGLTSEETQQVRTERSDQRAGGFRIRSLITLHPAIQFADWPHGGDSLLDI